MSRSKKIAGKPRHLFGWVPDSPDHRDLKYSAPRRIKMKVLPKRIDLRDRCPRVEDQGQIGSCTANAATSAMEFLYIAAGRCAPDLSRLFLYYATRVWVAHEPPTEDGGAMLRDVMKAFSTYGTCLEEAWPYDPPKYSTEPPQKAKKAALDHQILHYYKLGDLEATKLCLAEGYPVVGGFAVPKSIDSKETKTTGVVKYPGPKEQFVGGHAILFVGYDDKEKHFVFKNSWGTKWGDKGFGYLPYRYVTEHLANDFWTIRTAEL